MRARSPLFLLAILGALALCPACPAAAANLQIHVPGVSNVAVTVDTQGLRSARERQRAHKAGQPTRVERIVRRIPGWVRTALAVLAVMAIALTAFSLYERHRRRKAEHVALVDPLTGVANRLAFERRLMQEWRRSERYGRSLGVLLIDLDDFKQVNDSEGHAAGDELLKNVAQRMSSRLRETDMLARLGGDEFAAICPETSMPNLAKLAGSLERQVAELPGSPVGLSIGVAEYERGDRQPLDVIERADASMYARKRSRTRRPRHSSVAC